MANYDEQYARNIIKNSKYVPKVCAFSHGEWLYLKFVLQGDDEDFDPQMYEEGKGKKSEADFQASMKQRALLGGKLNACNLCQRPLADLKYKKTLENCWFCFDNPNIKKHLIVSLGRPPIALSMIL